jgi:hypothetical protein
MFGGGVQKNSDTPQTPPPPIGPIYISIDSSRRENSEYIIFNQFDTCRPKIMLTDYLLSRYTNLVSESVQAVQDCLCLQGDDA